MRADQISGMEECCVLMTVDLFGMQAFRPYREYKGELGLHLLRCMRNINWTSGDFIIEYLNARLGTKENIERRKIK